MITDIAYNNDLTNITCFCIQHQSVSNSSFIAFSRDLRNALVTTANYAFAIAVGDWPQWKAVALCHKVVYNIAPNKVLGCCKVSDDNYEGFINGSHHGLVLWTLSNDDFIVDVDRYTNSIVSPEFGDGEFFCFICY